MIHDNETQNLPAGAEEDESQWMTVRDAAIALKLSVVRIHQIVNQPKSPLIYKVVTRGRIQQQLKLWIPSVEALIRSREKEAASESWGRQPEPMLA